MARRLGAFYHETTSRWWVFVIGEALGGFLAYGESGTPEELAVEKDTDAGTAW